MYCRKCGGKVESYASHCPFCGEALDNNNVQATYTSSMNAVGSQNVKSVGSWILSFILSAIPLVGFILLLVWSFGNDTKSHPTFRNWARAQLILEVIAVVVIVVLYAMVIADILNSGALDELTNM